MSARRTSRRARLGLVLIPSLAFAFASRPAWAGELADPSAAQASADAARADKDAALTFCRSPRLPLSQNARALCPSAKEIPDCQGFASACDAALAPKSEREGDLLASLRRALAAIAQVLVYVLVLGVLVAIAIPIVQALRRRRRDAALADAKPSAAVAAVVPVAVDLPHVDDAEEALRRADGLAGAGELTRATYMYLAASLAALDQRGAIRITKSRTNGDYVRACSEAERRPQLRAVALEVDRVQFGGESATPARVERVAGLARALVRALPVGLLALALTGCDGSALRRHDDPAGDQLFVEVLRRQGFAVTQTGRGLSSLRPLSPEEASPVLVIDLDRTPLEPEAEAHVVAWVESGGVLVTLGAPSPALSKTLGLHEGPAVTKDARGLVALDASLTPLEPPAIDDDDDEDGPAYAARVARARDAATRHFTGWVRGGGSVEVDGGVALVRAGPESRPYAIAKGWGKGVAVAVHDGELLTNVAMARPGNPAVVAALFTELMAQPALTGAANERRVRQAREVRVARPEDGISPPANPVASLARAGLERGMWHALAACLVLFAAYGARHARPKPEGAPARRAFAEHVEATGALYARTPDPRHALAVFTRFAEERLRHSLPRGVTEVPAFLAARSGRPLADCEALWARAQRATAATAEDADGEARGDELATLRELRAALTAALRRDPREPSAAPRPAMNPRSPASTDPVRTPT